MLAHSVVLAAAAAPDSADEATTAAKEASKEAADGHTLITAQKLRAKDFGTASL